MQWGRPQARATTPQLLVSIMTVGKIAHRSGITLQDSAFISESHRNGTGPESRSVFPGLPAFGAHMTLVRGPLELFLQPGIESLLTWIKKGCGLPDGLSRGISVNARRSRIPGHNTSLDVEEVQCVVLHPGRNGAGRRRLVAQDQGVADGQHVPLGRVLHFARYSIRIQQLE